MSGMAHEMPMRYAVSSHQTTRPSREYDAGCGIERADELTLELESYKMPVKRAGQETISGAIFFIERELRAHADTIRFIRADESKDGNRINGFLHVTAQYNTCACPYCGNETALLHDQWRVLLDKHTDLPIVKSHVNSNGASIRLAKYPAENLPLGGSRFEPIESMKGQVSKPYGHGCRLPFEEFDMWRHQLVLSRDLLEDRDSTTRTFGMSGDYKGMYECQRCGKPYYVEIKDAQGPFVHQRDGNQPSPIKDKDFTLDSMKKVHVTVTTKSDRIAVEFDRPVGEKGNQTISYDLVGGIFEIDGYQLLKSDRVTSACLERLDYGFKCPELFELLKELMASEVEGLADSLPYIRKAKDQEGVEPHGLSSCFLELALANRFRGYPAAFYMNLFDTPDLAWSNKPELRPCTCLPLHYEDLQSHFDSSGLPRTEPIRQLAFQQPLFIAYARDMRETPFKDPDIIVDVLSQDDALRHLHNFQIALASTTELIWQRQSAFTYLRATRNERELWLLLKNQEQELGSYWCYCEFASVPHESTCATADEMPTEEAFDFLKDAVEDSWTACLGDE